MGDGAIACDEAMAGCEKVDKFGSFNGGDLFSKGFCQGRGGARPIRVPDDREIKCPGELFGECLKTIEQPLGGGAIVGSG